MHAGKQGFVDEADVLLYKQDDNGHVLPFGHVRVSQFVYHMPMRVFLAVIGVCSRITRKQRMIYMLLFCISFCSSHCLYF